MIIRKWVTLHILWKTVSSHLSQLLTGCELHYTFCERQSCHIFSHDQQLVSDIAHFVKSSLITYFPLTISKWVTLHMPWKAFSSHFLLWSTASEWHYRFCEGQSHHIFHNTDRIQWVAHFVKDSLITSCSMTNRESATSHVVWKAASSHLFLWQTACEWHYTFCERSSFPMTNREWATSDILSMTVSSSHLWPTACEWHFTFCERQSHHIFSYDQQFVSDIDIFWKAVSSHLF